MIEQVNIKNRWKRPNKYLIPLRRKYRWYRSSIPTREWEDVKANLGTGKYEDWFKLVGYCSYKAKVDGLAGIHENRNIKMRFTGLLLMRGIHLGIHFINGPYNELKIEPGSIYCDAPYIALQSMLLASLILPYYQWLKDTAIKVRHEYTMPAGFKDVDHWDLTVHSATVRGGRTRGCL